MCFPIPLDHFYVFFWKMSTQGLHLCFNWVFSFLQFKCRISLYVLIITPLSDIWFTNIFSHPTVDSSLCRLSSLLCRSFLVWCLFHLFIFPLLPMFLMSYPWNYCQFITSIFIAVLFTIAKIWNNIKCSEADE